MSGNLLKNPSFEDATLAPWQTTTGDVTQAASTTAFEGGFVANLDPTAIGDFAIISQLFQVGSGSHLHVSFAMRAATVLTTGEMTVEVQYFGSANVGLPLLRTDSLFVKEAGGFSVAGDWETAVVAANAKPSSTVWARIRFIVVGSTGMLDAIEIDNVVVTAE